jgi:hypothetical protein
MRPLGMIVFDEFPAQVVHVPLPEHHEVIEAFLLDALHEPLDKGSRIGRAICRSAGLDPGLLQSVEGGSKRRRRESVGAVEIGGAHWSISEKWQDGGVSPYSAPLRREAQECDPTWSFGKRFVGRC